MQRGAIVMLVASRDPAPPKSPPQMRSILTAAASSALATACTRAALRRVSPTLSRNAVLLFLIRAPNAGLQHLSFHVADLNDLQKAGCNDMIPIPLELPQTPE